MNPYYSDEAVTLYHGDCLEITKWLTADVLVTDPPYGIGWKRGVNHARSSKPHSGIANDHDTSARDCALQMWGDRPGVVFGSLYADKPKGVRHICVWEKPRDAGVVGSTTGFRRDVEGVYLIGSWPRRSAALGSILRSAITNAGSPSSPAGRTGHPHAKPVDLIEGLLLQSPAGVVADPFAGSGTTLIAARNQGRQAIGVEIEERYCEMIAKRLAQGVML